MSKHVDKNVMIVRLKWAWVFVSGLVLTNLFLSFFVGTGRYCLPHRRRHRCLESGEFAKAIIRRFLVCRAPTGRSVFGSGLYRRFHPLSLMPVRWDTKCSWRYCGRAMGPGLL